MKPVPTRYDHRDRGTESPREGREPWLVLGFRPVILTLMSSAVAFSLVELLQLALPDTSFTFLVLLSASGTLLGYYVYFFTRRLIPSEIDRRIFRRIFLLAAFFVIKFATYLSRPLSVFLDDLALWLRRPWEFFSLDAIVAFALFLLTWQVGLHTASDFARIGVPTEDRDEEAPLESISRRFFLGGIALIIFAGLTRIGIAGITRLARPPVSGLVLNVLLYFVLGLILLGQTRWVALVKRWARAHIPLEENLARRWIRYTVGLLLIAALVAFLLPTGYTVPLLDLAMWIVWLLWNVVLLLLFLLQLLLYPLLLLLSLLIGSPAEQPEPEFAPPPESLPPGPEGTTPPWFALVRSVLFWLIFLGLFIFLVRQYFRDHPQLFEAVRTFEPLVLLGRAWRRFWHWLRKLLGRVRQGMPRLELRRRLRQLVEERSSRSRRTLPDSARERIYHYYLETLAEAQAEGIPRRRSQTPHEYEGRLAPEIPEAEGEVAGLTSDFVEARYSEHPVAEEQVERVRGEAERVALALRARRRRREERAGREEEADE